MWCPQLGHLSSFFLPLSIAVLIIMVDSPYNEVFLSNVREDLLSCTLHTQAIVDLLYYGDGHLWRQIHYNTLHYSIMTLARAELLQLLYSSNHVSSSNSQSSGTGVSGLM